MKYTIQSDVILKRKMQEVRGDWGFFIRGVFIVELFPGYRVWVGGAGSGESRAKAMAEAKRDAKKVALAKHDISRDVT